MKHVIFDRSWTLSDDFSSCYEATMLVFEHLWWKRISIEEYKNAFELPYMNFYRKYFPDIKKEDTEYYIKAIYQVAWPKAYKWSKEILEFLASKWIEMILISSHPHEKLVQEVEEYGFKKYFKEVNGSVHDKAEVIQDILKRNNFAAQNTIYVGDMTHDIESWKHAKVKTVAITRWYQTQAQLEAYSPDYMIWDIKEVEGIVG